MFMDLHDGMLVLCVIPGRNMIFMGGRAMAALRLGSEREDVELGTRWRGSSLGSSLSDFSL
jgi:hypothetical protein